MGFANDIVEQHEGLNVVPASEVIRFDEQRDGDDVAADFNRLRDLFGASHMLATRLEKNASVLRLSYTLYKPDAEVERGTMVGGEPTELMRGMIRSVSAALGYRGGGVDEITVISEDPFINEAYSRGLGLALEGRCGEALQLFDVVIAGGHSDGRAEYERATCARVLGQWQDAEAGFNAILETVPEEPATSLRAQALNGLGTVYLRTGRNDQARETLRQGLEVAIAAADYRIQGMLLNSLAIDAKNRREYSEARELLARASLAHSEAGSGVLPGQLPAALANIDMAEGKLEQAENHLDQALAAFRALGDRRNEAMMLNNYGYLRRLQGRMDDAEPLHLQSLAIRREIGDRVGQGRILGMLSSVYVSNGRLDDALLAAIEAHEIASEANDKLFMATSLAQIADVEARLGEIDASREDYLESGALFDEMGDYSRFAQVTIRLAMLERDTGNLESAEATADEVLQLSLREGLQEPAIEAKELQGDIAREQSDTDLSIAAYHQALKHIEESGFVSRKIRIVRKLANVYLDVENLAAVEPLIGIMIEEGKTTESLILRARYASVKGDSEQALALMESAKEAAGEDWSESSEEVLAGYRVN
jgi:tetratricopeptide (TPR) repeat protein